jgi:RNA-binding protein 5/10
MIFIILLSSAEQQKNLEDDNLRRIAREKVAKAIAGTSKSAEESKPVYRDRASERRVIHGQPDIPLPEPSTGQSTGGGGTSRKVRDIPSSAPVIEEPAKEPAKDENNIGNKLLKKMGWSEGTGLGLSGEGRVDPM